MAAPLTGQCGRVPGQLYILLGKTLSLKKTCLCDLGLAATWRETDYKVTIKTIKSLLILYIKLMQLLILKLLLQMCCFKYEVIFRHIFVFFKYHLLSINKPLNNHCHLLLCFQSILLLLLLREKKHVGNKDKRETLALITDQSVFPVCIRCCLQLFYY